MDEDHETRRKIMRQWMALPKDKRDGRAAVAFAKQAVEQNEFIAVGAIRNSNFGAIRTRK